MLRDRHKHTPCSLALIKTETQVANCTHSECFSISISPIIHNNSIFLVNPLFVLTRNPVHISKPTVSLDFTRNLNSHDMLFRAVTISTRLC